MSAADGAARLTDAERTYSRVAVPGLRGRWYSEVSVERILADRFADVQQTVQVEMSPKIEAHIAALTQDRDDWRSAAGDRDELRAKAARYLRERDEARAVVEAVRALADEWDAEDTCGCGGCVTCTMADLYTPRLRALLPEPETSDIAEATCEGCGGTGVTQESHDGGTHPVHCRCTYGGNQVRKVWLSDREYLIEPETSEGAS